MAIIEYGHQDHMIIEHGHKSEDDTDDHDLLWLLCDMSAQQADSESFLQMKVSKVSKERNFLATSKKVSKVSKERNLLATSKKVSKVGIFLQLTKIRLESTVNNCEASIVI